MALSNIASEILKTLDAGKFRSPSWTNLVNEYRSARLALEQLLKESAPISTQAEALIQDLDKHFQIMENRMEHAVPFDRSLTSPLPPPIDRKKVKGMLAYRAWEMAIKGVLAPAVMSGAMTWKSEVAFADAIPKPFNTHGLHAHRLEYWANNSYSEDISGLVDCYGKVVEHGDGVIRAECARVLTIIIEVSHSNDAALVLTGAYDLLTHYYPNTPVYVFSKFQKKMFIEREILINYGAV